MRRLIPILIGLAIAGGVAYSLWPKPIPVDLATVTVGPLRVTIDEEGKTRIKQRYVVSAALAGRLRRIELRAGDEVVAGKTLLAVIEPSNPELLDTRARATSLARVKGAEAGTEQAKRNLEATKAALDFAESEFRRSLSLMRRDQISKKDLEAAEMQIRMKKEEHQSSEFAVQIAKFELEQAKAALTQFDGDISGGENGPRFEIRSPIDGKVLRVMQESAAVVAPSTPLLELGNPRDLEVEVDVLSTDAVKIPPGAETLLEHWGGGKTLAGHVRLVEPAAFTKVSALGVEEQRVNVLIDFDGPPEERASLGDAYRVEARIVIWRSPEVLKVPSGSLFRHESEWAVFVVEDGVARLRMVRAGQGNALETEILDGLRNGDSIIAHPSDKITDGVNVINR